MFDFADPYSILPPSFGCSNDTTGINEWRCTFHMIHAFAIVFIAFLVTSIISAFAFSDITGYEVLGEHQGGRGQQRQPPAIPLNSTPEGTANSGAAPLPPGTWQGSHLEQGQFHSHLEDGVHPHGGSV